MAIPRSKARGGPGPGWVLAALVLVPACGGGGSSGPSVTVGGMEVDKPDGSGTFILDPNRAGRRTRVGLVEVTWGRLVDVHALDANGQVDAVPAFEGLVIDENVVSDSIDFTLETNPVTLETRLVILRQREAPDDGTGTFAALLQEVSERLPAVVARRGGATGPGPFSLVPRDATLVLRFDDLLDDSPDVERELDRLVRVVANGIPFPARVVFDQNHGGIADGEFHSTRVLVDTTVSPIEAETHPTTIGINVLGFPARTAGSVRPNAEIRIPTVTDPSSGQNELLRALGGGSVAGEKDLTDFGSSTLDTVRAFRTGHRDDLNGGALFDFAPPRLVGRWRITLEEAVELEDGLWSLDLVFENACGVPPRRGDVIEVGARFIEVVDAGRPVPSGAADIHVRPLAGPAVERAADLVGLAFQVELYDELLAIPAPCWLTVIPETELPGKGLSSHSTIEFRFSEPMTRGSVRALDTMRMVRGGFGAAINARSLVIGNIVASQDLRTFAFTPSLPFDNRTDEGVYLVELVTDEDGVRDLAGNTFRKELPSFELELDPDEPAVINGGFGLTFATRDEAPPLGLPDLRGLHVWDEEHGALHGRPVEFGTAGPDGSQGPASLMTLFTPGVQTPLSALGSKLLSVWRYADMSWSIYDETKYDIDVTGISWSTVNEVILADYFPRFSIRMGHGRFLPDEFCEVFNTPEHEASGLVSENSFFSDNELEDPRAGMQVVHPVELGYRIDPADVYHTTNGVPMVPYPMNRHGGKRYSFTWRDTSIQARAGWTGPGVPMAVEVKSPLKLEEEVGAFARVGQVPSVGLPLLWEIGCYPSPDGVGLNPVRIMIPCLGWHKPNFRVYSTGGIDTEGEFVTVDPSTERRPRGGFSPTSTPPGRRTRSGDNSFYLGEIDYAVRTTRSFSTWMDTIEVDPEYAAAVIEPDPSQQPVGTSIQIEFRGANGFVDAGNRPFDSRELDVYGDFRPGMVDFFLGDASWKSDLTSLSGARYLQYRITFLANLETGDVPSVESVGIAFRGR